MGGLFGDAPTIPTPEKRNYLSEMQSALDAQAGIQGQLLSLEKQYTPQYQELQKQALMGQMGVLGSLYGSTIPQSEALGNQILASQGRLYGGIGQQALGAYQAGLSPATMGLYNTIMQQGQTGLEAGYGLTPQQEQMAQQSARAAMTARGLAGGGQGVAKEILNSYQLSNERYQQNLANATNAYGLGLGQTANAYQMYGSPLMAQVNAVNPSGLLNQAGQTYGALGAKLFQPESQYNAALNTANIQNQMQAQMANAQIQASQDASMIGLLGAGLTAGASMWGASTLAGALGGAAKTAGTIGTVASKAGCWVAREVYGENDVRWEIFRNWLTTEAPEWLYKLYIENGERFAEYIFDKPFLKSIIKSLMNIVVIPRYNKYKQFA